MAEDTTETTEDTGIKFPEETPEELSERGLKKVFAQPDPPSQLNELRTQRRGMETGELPIGNVLEIWKDGVAFKNEAGVIAQGVINEWNDLKGQPAIKSEDLGRFIKNKAALAEQLAQIDEKVGSNLEKEGIIPKKIEEVDKEFRTIFSQAVEENDKQMLEDLRELFPSRYDLAAEAARNQIAEQINKKQGTLEAGR
jgi:hypothetical protein